MLTEDINKTLDVSKIQNPVIISPENPPTVEELKDAGYTVEINHYRYYWDSESKFIGGLAHSMDFINRNLIAPFGGECHVSVLTPDNLTYCKVARCNLSDNYNKKLGVQICLGRICKQIIEDLEFDSDVPF